MCSSHLSSIQDYRLRTERHVISVVPNSMLSLCSIMLPKSNVLWSYQVSVLLCLMLGSQSDLEARIRQRLDLQRAHSNQLAWRDQQKQAMREEEDEFRRQVGAMSTSSNITTPFTVIIHIVHA